MKGIITALLLSICSNAVTGQNLVTNPGFESYTQCPDNINGLDYAAPWFTAAGTPDYFNACDTGLRAAGVPNNAFGTQQARTGVAYAGFYASNFGVLDDGREYIETKLTQTLSRGVKYRVRFYLSLADQMQYATHTIGVYFSATKVRDSIKGRLYYKPQIVNKASNPLIDKSGWMTVEGTFMATGNELYMTIGNYGSGHTQ